MEARRGQPPKVLRGWVHGHVRMKHWAGYGCRPTSAYTRDWVSHFPRNIWPNEFLKKKKPTII